MNILPNWGDCGDMVWSKAAKEVLEGAVWINQDLGWWSSQAREVWASAAEHENLHGLVSLACVVWRVGKL